MLRPDISLMTSEPPERTLELVTSTLKEAGYGTPSPTEQGLTFRPEGALVAGVKAFPHKLAVEVRSASRGSTLKAEFDTRGPSRTARLAALAPILLERLKSALPEGVALYEGVVSQDARRVDFAGPRPEWEMGPLPNVLPENSKWLQGLFLGFALFFWGIAAVAVTSGLLGWTTDRAAVPVGIGFALFATLLGFLPVLYLWRSAAYPRFVLISFEGLRLEYGHRKPVDIPWERFEDISFQATGGAQPPGGDWGLQGVYRDARGKTRKVRLSPMIAQEVRESRATIEDLRPLLSRPHAAAAIYAVAGTRVFVAERPLTREEGKHYALTRRYLERGRILPVYPAATEDTRLLLDYGEGKHLKAADLRFLGLVALARESWDAAVALLKGALQDEPEDQEAAYLLGGALLKAGRREEGERALDGFLARRERSPRAHVMRAILAMEAKVEPDALRHLTRAAELEPNFVEAYEVWFDVVAAMEGPEVAVAELEAAGAARPQAWAPQLALGRRLHMMGKLEKALPLFESARSRASNDETLSSLAKSYLAVGTVDRAVALLEAEKAKGALGPWSALLLAQAYAVRGQRGRARSTLDAVPIGDDLNVYGAWRAVRTELARTG